MVQIRAYANVMDSEDPPFSLSLLDVEESYNSGWNGAAVLATSADSEVSLSTSLSLLVTSGLGPSAPVAFLIALSGDTIQNPNIDSGTLPAIGSLPPGTTLRAWPSIVVTATPMESTANNVGANIHLTFTDTVSYLGGNPIWGAYRNTTLAEVIGGGISLAVGGDGKPTLNPITPGMPTIRIVDEMREGLGELPYVVAAGDTLSSWLGDLQRLIGFRLEMRLNAKSEVEMVVTDQPTNHRTGDVPPGFLPIDGVPDDSIIPLSFDSDDYTPGDNEINEISIRHAEVTRLANKPASQNRGIVLDDPLRGAFRRLGAAGSVGTLITGTGISYDEVMRRAVAPLYGRYLDSLVTEIDTMQTGMRPGRVVNFEEAYLGIDDWQIFSVRHLVNGTEYHNRARICTAKYAWLPASQFNKRAPVYVTAIVDGGSKYNELDPIPRDRLGRIPITFSFLPRPVGEEGDVLNVSDIDADGHIGLDDFTSDELADYKERTEYWEAELVKYRAGELDDPHEERDDDELTEEEREERKVLADQKRETMRYLAAKWAIEKDELDRDQDGVITDRDTAISNELEALLRNPKEVKHLEDQIQEDKEAAQKQLLEQQANERESEEGETEVEPPPPSETEEEEDPDRISQTLVDEYKSYFQMYDGEGQDPNLQVKIDAARAQGRWPTRIPVTAIEGMAGSLHGLISAHRQGDICRIAVHDPLSIELVGYQYRSDRQINDSLVGAATGMVVDHNKGEAWSGFVFRSTASLEGE